MAGPYAITTVVLDTSVSHFWQDSEQGNVDRKIGGGELAEETTQAKREDILDTLQQIGAAVSNRSSWLLQ
jgi:hypothetical protein